MKFQIVSDLHLEFNRELKFEDVIEPCAPDLILAGDIGHIIDLDRIKPFLRKCLSAFRNVVYILGNHEYYRDVKTDTFGREKTMKELIGMLRDFAEKISTKSHILHIVDKSVIVVGDVCIAGCTLWSKPEVPVPPFIVRISDMSTSVYNKLHTGCVRFVNKAIEYAERKKLKLLMIIHYPPVEDLAVRTDKFRSLYSSDLEHLTKKVHTWVYGHVHKNSDYVNKYGCRLVSNQKGKPKDGAEDFSPAKVIEI